MSTMGKKRSSTTVIDTQSSDEWGVLEDGFVFDGLFPTHKNVEVRWNAVIDRYVVSWRSGGQKYQIELSPEVADKIARALR